MRKEPKLPDNEEHPQAADAGTAAWHIKLHHTRSDDLDEDTAQTPGMRRYEAISGKRTGSQKLWMGKNHVGPGLVSADHHHGESEDGHLRRVGAPRVRLP